MLLRHRFHCVQPAHVLGSGTQSQNLEVLQLVLEDVDEPVVALRIDGRHVEAGSDNVGGVVADQTLYDLAVIESSANPETLRGGKMVVKTQIVMPFPLERFNEEDSFHAIQRAPLHRIRAEGPDERWRPVQIQVFGGRPLASLRITLYGTVSKLDAPHVGVGRIPLCPSIYAD